MDDDTRSATIVGPVDAGWTVVTLKEYSDRLFAEYDRRYMARFAAQEQAVKDAFAAQEKAIDAALRTQQAAVNKAELSSDKRFESVNEFRSQLGDQARTFMPRSESEARHNATADKLQDITLRMDRRDAANIGGQQVWGYVAAAVGVMVGIAGVLLAFAR